MKPLIITKSSYLQYLSCREEFWMQKHQPELIPPLSLDSEFKIEQGNLIDREAQVWFKANCKRFKPAIHPDKVRFQFMAKVDDFEAIADIIVFKNEKQCDIYEVKAATKLKPEHLDDIAFQKMVFIKAGYEVQRTFLVHVNNKYIFQGDIDLNQLLKIEDVTTSVNQKLVDTEARAYSALKFLKLTELPKKRIQVGCSNQLRCPYIQHYHSEFPNYNIYDIRRINPKKLQSLIDKGIKDIRDVPSEIKLSPKQNQQVRLAQENKIILNTTQIHEILGKLSYPLYFLGL